MVETLRPVALNGSGCPPEAIQENKSCSWWDRYSLAISKLPEDTRSILEADARYISTCALPMIGREVDISAFGRDRVRTGIVVGSVQSGKTANMLAVAALLLDCHVDMLVILAGTRVALWLQTYERLLNQLDGTDLYSAWQRNSHRVLVPQPEDILSGDERVDPVRYLRGARLRVKNALENQRPIIFVVPKEDDHLLALAKFLDEHIESGVSESRGRTLNLVVLDDEADDASILDARECRRITPKFIQNLWSLGHDESAPRHKKLLATYIAYTATPQANYLQRTHNPLAPRDFHVALRVPSDKGELSVRTVTYTERTGLRSYYCGGEIYYERLRGVPGDFCIPFPFPSSIERSSEEFLARYVSVRWTMIGEAIRSYLVAGAVRLYLSGRRLSDVPQAPVTREYLIDVIPETHSMLFHPSALKEMHFSGAEDIIRWSKSPPGEEHKTELSVDDFAEPLLAMDVNGLIRRLNLEEKKWQTWLEEFSATANSLSSLPGGSRVYHGSLPWQEIRRLLIDEVFPHVQLRVLNSDSRADDRPEFEPIVVDTNQHLWRAPRDLFTIFVAGNVLSRGLTVEGLCTSLFLRSAREPAADTQMQMQRWFGYRGTYLPFCRVFLFEDQLQLFRHYHHNDIALKSEILNHMDGHSTPFGSGVLVLRGENFSATAKIDSRRVPLHPGGTPAIRLVEPSAGLFYEQNLQVVSNLLEDGEWTILDYPKGVGRGLIRKMPLSMIEVAQFLEKFRYSCHDPDMSLGLSQRWVSLQRLLGLADPLFRPPGHNPGPMTVDPSGCPYSIAAYLRLWNEALNRYDLPGMQPTDNPNMSWSMVNVARYREDAPQFYIGLRFGSGGESKIIKYSGNPISLMCRGFVDGRSDLLDALWGSRNPSERWRGDQAFDYHFHNVKGAPQVLDSGAWRVRGQPGLLLIHPIVEPGTGKELISLGLAIPHGGPDHVAALRVGCDNLL